MSNRRVICRNWVVRLTRSPLTAETHFNPSRAPIWVDRPYSDRTIAVRDGVAKAIAALDDDRREIIERYFFMGQPIAEMADLSGRSVRSLERLFNSALSQLKSRLAPLAANYYGIGSSSTNSCVLCASPDRCKIDQVLAARDPTRPWKIVLKSLNEAFNLNINKAQTLINHVNHHGLLTDQTGEYDDDKRFRRYCLEQEPR